MNIERGGIYWASLDPVLGSETGNKRPIVILSNDINNQYNSTVTVIPITSNTERLFVHDVFVPKGEANLPKDSKIKCDQIRTIDKSRIIGFIGKLLPTYIEKIELATKIHLDL